MHPLLRLIPSRPSKPSGQRHLVQFARLSKEAETWEASWGQFIGADKWSVWKGTCKLINCITGASVLTEARGLDEWVDVCALFYTVNLADARRGWCVAMVIWARHGRAKKGLPNRTRLLRTDKMRTFLRESCAPTAPVQRKHINDLRITSIHTWLFNASVWSIFQHGGWDLHFAYAWQLLESPLWMCSTLHWLNESTMLKWLLMLPNVDIFCRTCC